MKKLLLAIAFILLSIPAFCQQPLSGKAIITTDSAITFHAFTLTPPLSEFRAPARGLSAWLKIKLGSGERAENLAEGLQGAALSISDFQIDEDRNAVTFRIQSAFVVLDCNELPAGWIVPNQQVRPIVNHSGAITSILIPLNLNKNGGVLK